MDTELIKITGQVAGIGGLGLGIFLLLFREIIRKNIFPKFKNEQLSYRLLRLILVLVWSVALIGIVAWLYTNNEAISEKPQSKDDASQKLTDWYTGTWKIDSKKTINGLPSSLLSTIDQLGKETISKMIDIFFNREVSKQEKLIPKFSNKEYFEWFIQEIGLQLTLTPTYAFGQSQLNGFKIENEGYKNCKLCKSFATFENPRNGVKIIPFSNSVALTEQVNRNLFYYDSKNILKKESIQEGVTIHKTGNRIYLATNFFLYSYTKQCTPDKVTKKSEFIPIKIYLERVHI